MNRVLIVGVGSFQGDDRAGWLVASALQRQWADHPQAIRCRWAQAPSDLFDWLDDVARLIVCDACDEPTQVGAIRQWQWPADRFVRTRSSSSHQLGLPEVLDLAAQVGRLPPRVEIWGISGSQFAPESEPSARVCDACQRLAAQLSEDLQRA